VVVLEARELYRFFHAGEEEVKALRGVFLSARAKEMVALVGPSGSGKSTLLNCLSGLDEPDGGMVRIMDEAMTRQPESRKRQLRARFIGVMRQKNNLFSHLSVAQNISLAQSLNGRDDRVTNHKVLERMGMESRAAFLPPQLSGGERARAGLAVAMACKPSLLFLDEPTGEVDVDTETSILELLADYCHGGGTIVVATHNAAVARMATRTLNMQDGKMVDD
jgi:putative ABC transport system ATP-binding protein